MKNYYQVLGLEPNATPEEVKRNFREYASKFHPDIHRGDSFFKERFQEIQEAYDILKDPQKREEYDFDFWGETNNTEKNSPSPQIISFTSSHQEISIGDVISIGWEVTNAQRVTMSLFNGYKTITYNDLPTHGVKKLKLTSLKTSIHLTIQAIGFNNQEIKSKEITIRKKDEVQEDRVEDSSKNEKSNGESISDIIIVLLYIALILFGLLQTIKLI